MESPSVHNGVVTDVDDELQVAASGDTVYAAYRNKATLLTTIFRREDGEWKVVHRHADPASENASALAQRMGVELRKIGAPPL